MEDLYTVNYKWLLKEIKDLSEQKDILWSWIGKLNIIKMVILPKLAYRFNALYPNPNGFFPQKCKNLSSNRYGIARDSNNQTILEKKNKIKRLILPNFKTYYKDTVVTTVRHNRPIERQNRIKSPEINPHLTTVPGIQWRKEQPLPQMTPGNWMSTSKRMKVDTYLTVYTKINKVHQRF